MLIYVWVLDLIAFAIAWCLVIGLLTLIYDGKYLFRKIFRK